MKLLSKLALLGNERLPGKRVFFIYTHKNGYDRFAHGLKANTEISYFCFSALKEAFGRVTFLRLADENPARIARITNRDVVVGHPGETFMKASLRTRKLITFAPFVGHEDHVTAKGSHCSDKDEEMSVYAHAQCSILLTSEYNKREYLDRERNFWAPFFRNRRYRVVHQPIDLTLFKRNKMEYTTSDFLYVGHLGHMKCVPSSVALVAEVGRTLHLFGTENKRLNNRDQQQIAALPKLADFFIQPGMWEAQSVAILEAAARGFIPIVSPETGYPYIHPYLLRYDDHSYNLATLKRLLTTTAEERKELGDALYCSLLHDNNHNAWKKLTDVLVEEVGILLAK